MNDNTINIAFCTDDNYLKYVAIAIKSIQLNNLNNNLQFHVFLYDVSDDELEKFKKLDIPIKTYFIEQKQLEQYQIEHKLKHINRSMYIRLLVPRLLKNQVNRFIYLDADILCFGDISTINKINIESVVCAVISDSLNAKNLEKNITRLNLKSGNYFNSGFLYINTKNWCDYNIESEVNQILLNPKNNKLIYPDQDALNMVLYDKVIYIDNKWNYLFTWMNDTEKQSFFENKQCFPFFIHFTGARKPWYKEHVGLAQNLYLFYKHFTPWGNESLPSYLPKMRVNDYRIYAKSFLKKGKLFKGIKFITQYLVLKFFKKNRNS